MSEAYICDFVRTPIGRYEGGLARVRADDLAAAVIKHLVARNAAVGEAVEEPDGPGNGGDQGDGKVVPEGLLVAVEVGAKAGEIVLEEEDAEELRGVELDKPIPGGGDGEVDG